MNNILENKKEFLRNTNTSIDITNYIKNDRAPLEIRSALNLFDKAVNPFLDVNEKERHIKRINNLEENNTRLSMKKGELSCNIEISNEEGILKYEYDIEGITFSLKTDLYEIVHRYRIKPDKYSSGEDLYIKSKTGDFEYNLTSGIIYKDTKENVRFATRDDIVNTYFKLFYFINKADSIAFDNLYNEYKVKEMK